MFGLKLIYIHGNDSWGAWVARPIVSLIRPTSLAMVAFVVLLVSFVRRELASVRKFAISLIMRHLRMLQTAMLLAVACMVGCDATKPEKFTGFASEQLSEQIEVVSAKLDESIEENYLKQAEILRAVKDLSQTVAGMQLASQQQVEELKKVTTKAKTKLTSTGDEKAAGVATLDPNGAPTAKLQLDSLDDAAAQIEALTKRIDELEKRCNSFASAKVASSSAGTSGGGSTGSLKSSSGGSTGTLAVSSYQAPVYSYETMATQPTAYSGTYYAGPAVQSSPVFQSSESNTCYVDPVTGQTVCNRNMSQSSTQSVRRGLFGRIIGR